MKNAIKRHFHKNCIRYTNARNVAINATKRFGFEYIQWIHILKRGKKWHVLLLLKRHFYLQFRCWFSSIYLFFFVMPFTIRALPSNDWLYMWQAQMFGVIRIDPIQIEKEHSGNRNLPKERNPNKKLDLSWTKWWKHMWRYGVNGIHTQKKAIWCGNKM